MNRLLILESIVPTKPAGYDHVFSLSVSEGDSYPEDYIEPQETEEIEDQRFDYLMNYLKRSIDREKFCYRGVSLLWCFKKKFINLISFAEGRYLVFKRLVEALEPEMIYLEVRPEEVQAPFLKTIFELSPLKQSLKISLIPPLGALTVAARGSSRKKDSWIHKESWIHKVWPRELSRGRLESAEVGIYSDLKKAHSVIKALQPTQAVLFSDVLTPRMWSYSRENSCGMFQSSYNEKAYRVYREKAERYANLLREENPFSAFECSELNWRVGLLRISQELFRKELPRLLYMIDRIHDFFQKCPRLKAVLLDEDINPIRNAFCQTARIYGVSSFVACHGGLGKKGSYLPLTADHIFVWGNAQKRKLSRWGCPEEKIIVSGCGRFASFRQKDPEKTRIEVAKKIGLDATQPIVLVGFVTSAGHRRRLFENRRRKLMSEILSLAKEYPKVQFVIKIKNHLDTNGKFCEDWIQANGLEKRVITVYDVDALILAIASDLIIVHGTTLGIEAFAMKKPVLSYYERLCRIFEEYRQHSAFLVADNERELKKVFADLIEKRKSFQPDAFRQARLECLNEGGRLPEEIIASCLLSCEKGRLGAVENVERVFVER